MINKKITDYYSTKSIKILEISKSNYKTWIILNSISLSVAFLAGGPKTLLQKIGFVGNITAIILGLYLYNKTNKIISSKKVIEELEKC